MTGPACELLDCDQLVEAWLALDEHRAEHRGEVCCYDGMFARCSCPPCGTCVELEAAARALDEAAR